MARSPSLQLPRLSQVHYFTGQLLTAADFEHEQAYHRERARLHNRLLHGVGVVAGLTVTASRGEVVVTAGLALDQLGDEVLLDAEQRLSLAGLLKDSAPRFVVARHVVTLTEPVPVIGSIEGEQNCTRMVHGALLNVEVTEPKLPDAGVTLARLVWRSGKWRVDARFRRRRVKC